MMRIPLLAAVAAMAWISQAGRPPLLFRDIAASTDVAWLERLCVDLPYGQAEYAARGGNTGGVKGNRSAAYVRLGAIGTTESLAAIHRIEAAARGRSVLPPPATPETPFYHPAPHMSDGRWWVAAQARLDDGRDAAAFILDLYGPRSLFIALRRAGVWTPPMMVPAVIADDALMTIAGLPGGRLRLTLAEKPHAPSRMSFHPTPDALEFRLEDIENDADGDGWTDIAERHLQMNWRSADSDGDGIPDGRDAAPGYRPTLDEADAEAQMLKRSVFAMFGLTEAPGALFVADTSRRLQFDGLPGPVFYREGNGGVRVTWKVESKTEIDATVELTDFEGALAASGNAVKLRKINGEWFVVSIQMKWIS
jgi:hypothetical protein